MVYTILECASTKVVEPTCVVRTSIIVEGTDQTDEQQENKLYQNRSVGLIYTYSSYLFMSFPNSYWTPDYRIGIDRLSQQSIQSLNQLHDLRRLVFNYMNYHYSNSEYLTRLGKEAYNTSNKLDVPSGTNTGSALKRLSDQFIEATKLDYQLKPHESLASYTENSLTPYKLHLHQLSMESSGLITLSSVIDNKVLEPITAFLKKNEPMVRGIFGEFEDLLLEYEKSYKEIEKVKKEFEDYSSMKELDEKRLVENVSTRDTAGSSSEDDSDEERDLPPLNVAKRQKELPITPTRSKPVEQPAKPVRHFPLVLGPVSVSDAESFQSFIAQTRTEIDTIKRKIPIPGFKNETFSSDSLCEWVTRRRPFAINPTRVNLERFGQALIDQKVIIGVGFIGAKKFKSEGMWFEWVEDPESSTPKVGIEEETEDSPGDEKKEEITSTTTGPILTVNGAPVTPKRNISGAGGVGGLFSNIRTSILKTNYPQLLKQLEHKYNELYLEIHQLRHDLDSHMLESTQRLEKFEKERIELTYFSLTKLLQILYDFSLASTNRLHKFTTELIEDVNKPENYNDEFQKIMRTFSTGIFFPSVISPDNLYRQHYLSHQTNSNFQNVTLKFNLYKDFPLQPLIRNSTTDENILLSISSIPEFLYKFVTILQERSDETTLPWINPLDGDKYWTIKQSIINIVNTFTPNEDVTDADELVIHRQIITQILKFLSQRTTEELVNFLKYWLLEISDSLIPFTYYDRVLETTSKNEFTTKAKQIDSFIQLLSLLPRSNLSSLIFLIEHICGIFKLGKISNYGKSDDLENTELVVDSTLIESTVKDLNSMELIGAIPFLHLLMRPSAVKSTSGFKPPILKYNIILRNLLDLEIRSKLFQSLVSSEQKYISKREKEKKLPLLLPAHVTTSENVVPKSPKPTHPENFTLRPFRTRATPNPSPTTSPRREVALSSAKLDPITRPRSTSNTFLTPQINIEYEEK